STLLTGTSALTQPSPTGRGLLPSPVGRRAGDEGNVIIAGIVQGEQVDLYATGQITPTDYEWVQGDTTVVRFPGAEGTMTLSMIDVYADNAQALLFGGTAGTIATIVGETENGIEAINQTLDRIDAPLDGLSITAEGNVGSFWLGNTWITHETVQNYQTQLAQWSSAFTESADLLLYSCFTALGETGEALMASLANATGLDVAASVNVTGSASQGGDWVLESSTGNIETQTPFMDETLADWEGALATLTVDSALDNTTTDGVVTLREAIIAANTDGMTDAGEMGSGADEIRFSGVTQVNLTSALSDITEELTITGGDTNVTIAGNNTTFRIFNVTGGVATTFDNLTITGGKVTGDGGGISSDGAVTVSNSTISGNSSSNHGGGIYSNGAVTVTNSTLSGNSATGRAGGIYSRGAVTLSNSTLSGNSSNSGGGGISNRGNVTLSNSTVSSNSAGGGGGGISSNGDVTLTNSTVSNNLASNIGGIFGFGDVTLTNSTVSGNSSNGTAGGINSSGAVTVTNSTVSGNSANTVGGGIVGVGAVTLTNSTISGNSSGNRGGGIFSFDAVNATNSTIAFNSAAGNGGGIHASDPSSLNNTIVANNTTGATEPDLFGTFTVNSSLILDPSGATISGSNNIIGQDPLLQALANNGGSTQTHALQTGSPALDSGNNALVTTTTDQRGEVRISNGTVDIGAYEFVVVESSAVAVTTLNVASRSDFETQIEGLTAACPTIPEVEIASELSSEPLAALERDGRIEQDGQCLPVAGD
ncbi:MAG: DUF4347 domain-containing protein, partial [Spirulina sp. SIO3F2]|nr:DUF4347 domain-containing protein [Spirulina sp. SIO3F2]